MNQTDAPVTQSCLQSPLAHAACIFFHGSAAWSRESVVFLRLAGLSPNSFRAPVRAPSATPAGVLSLPLGSGGGASKALATGQCPARFSVLVVRVCSRDTQTGVGQQVPALWATLFRRSAAWVINPRRCDFRAGRELVSLLVLL